MARKYDNKRFDAKNVKSTVEFAKSLNEQSAVTITVSALALQHIMTLVQIFAALIAEKPRTAENLEKYATYVAKAKNKGVKEADIDGWETWSRRSNTYAFVNSHAKDESTGKWTYQGKAGEILLQVERAKSDAALTALKPVFDQLNDNLLDELIGDLQELIGSQADELV